MTMFKPTLIINRLLVVKDNHVVLDIKFHKGVNIVSGHNSSGKTTVLDFITYTLGAENVPWKKEADLCDASWVEISLNERPITLRRDVNQKPLNPLHFFWGGMPEAIAADFSKWETYPFRRSSSKISFTQAILLALELPEAQGDGASNLTMHQFLRVIYADQPSLHSPIFRPDNFDSVLTRETVGNYLCGIYDDNLYAAQLERRTLDKELAALTSELRSIFAVFARTQQDYSLEFFKAQLDSLEHDRNLLSAELSRLKSERTVEKNTVGDKKSNEQLNLRRELDKAKQVYFEESDRLTRVELELADSHRFVDELRSRLASIDESAVTRNYFGSINFQFCPCCLGAVETADPSSLACALCKSPIEPSIAEGQLLRMKNELRIQLAESTKIAHDSEELARTIRTILPSRKQNLLRLEKNYQAATQIWSSDLESAVENSARALGEIDQQIKSLHEMQKLALVIEELQRKRAEVSDRFIEVDGIIEKLEFAQEERKRHVSLSISETLKRLLREDLDRQEEFKNPDKVEFSFSDNSITINGANKFSESSTVVLRHLFHIALLSASTKDSKMRFPRLLILDGIEDGGLEPARAQLLQEIIVRECLALDVDYQMIFASSQIAPSLNSAEYVVGRTFSESNRSLSIGSSS
jgi:hypothetical protein